MTDKELIEALLTTCVELRKKVLQLDPAHEQTVGDNADLSVIQEARRRLDGWNENPA